MSELLSQEEMEDLGLEAEQVNFVCFLIKVLRGSFLFTLRLLLIKESQFMCVERFYENFRWMFLRSVLMGLRMKRELYQQKM